MNYGKEGLLTLCDQPLLSKSTNLALILFFFFLFIYSIYPQQFHTSPWMVDDGVTHFDTPGYIYIYTL